MAKVVAKAKKKSASKKHVEVSDQALEEAFAEIEERADKRYEYAFAIKEIQDEQTTVAINRLVARMASMAGEPSFSFKGRYFTDRERLGKVQYYNHLWIAIRVLVACAEWDIRIANFKLPKHNCARCGKKVKG